MIAHTQSHGLIIPLMDFATAVFHGLHNNSPLCMQHKCIVKASMEVRVGAVNHKDNDGGDMSGHGHPSTCT